MYCRINKSGVVVKENPMILRKEELGKLTIAQKMRWVIFEQIQHIGRKNT